MDFFNSFLTFFGKIAMMLFIGINLLLSPAPPAKPVTTSTPPAPTVKPAATSTPTTTKPATATSTKVVKTPTTKTPPKKATPVASSTPSVPKTPPVLLDTQTVDKATRAGLVNILCTVRFNDKYSSISGSGIFIDSRGLILTNAHVAQYFLLRDYPTPGASDCTIRTGSPAQSTYSARLLYLPPTWVDTNASQIVADDPKGTGENDYAFLLVSSAANASTPLPASFPSMALNLSEPIESDTILLAAYPAGFLNGASIQSGLYILSSIAIIKQLFTFDDPHRVDVISLGGTAVSQSGSSGGAVVEMNDGKLIGIIATESEGTTTASRDLNAITLGHINRSLESLGKGGIAGIFAGTLSATADNFNQTTAPQETQKIEAVLRKAGF